MPAEAHPQRLADLGERGIYRQVLEPNYRTVAGFGDDCATFGSDLVITTDTCPTPLLKLVTGKDDPYHEGWLLATINLSDLAAAGALPEGLVVNYTLPPSTPVAELKEIIRGVDDCARRHGTTVLGGDIRDGRERHLCATAVGRSPYGRLSRRGARAGDALLLVGNPGYLWGAVLVHRREATLHEQDERKVLDLARRPVAQVQAGCLLAEHKLAAAAVDVSDGLSTSVRILAERNGLGAEVESKIELDPALQSVCDQTGVSNFHLGQTWGDWCLLVAVRPEQARQAEQLLADHGIGVRRIGQLVGGHRNLVVGTGSDARPWRGFDQERFTETSWHGDGIEERIALMKSPV
jgi:thiamine-monophosphate kinase